METRVWESGLLLLIMVFVRLISAESVTVSSSSEVCHVASFTDSMILRFQDMCMDSDNLSNEGSCGGFVGVTEGDEDSLQKALDLIHRNQEYIAVLFYASWCPFSRTSRPTFSVLSSLYPGICHFAVEELSVRPSTLSRYRVHGFPTLFLLNSTTRVRYHGFRTINSLVTFYNDVTGIKPASLDVANSDAIKNATKEVKLRDPNQENCPFSWAWFPKNLFHQETYLRLATMFVLLRMIYFFHPILLTCALATWRRHIQNRSLVKLWEHPISYLHKASQFFSAMKEPCKKRNLQEGALNAGVWASKSNAGVWASKSLASVSIGDASSS